VVVVGAQWGDEGKGKIVDLFTEFADVVVRYQGGANAGHTVKVGDSKLVLHLIPSGIFRKGTRCIIGPGVVVDPEALLEEIALVRSRGFLTDPQELTLSDAAHLVLPYHKRLDRGRERSPSAQHLGTTGRGIGPAYEDKAGRVGIRVADLYRPYSLKIKVTRNVEAKNPMLRELGEDPLDVDALLCDLQAQAEALRPFVGNAARILDEHRRRGKEILFEGAQGTMLDVDHGTYPFVTSSSTVAGGACTGGAIGPTHISAVLGVTKAYTTRVGEGPFPTELQDEIGARLREEGDEYGATTGRPRRCGWLDLVALRHAARVNGLTGIAVTKLDVLCGIPRLKVCVAYDLDGERTEEMPLDAGDIERCRPIYEEVDGWTEGVRDARTLDELPRPAREYLAYLSRALGLPVSLVSVGPGRTETILVQNPFAKGGSR
jgi:adenylosuccinate synthase